ncbi:hypothetical protein LCGC14_0652040 [marine sediment metagenome]|uniref:Uncharacterized protein n=1 Tax=marine sediment metagenome TaxID=412755 RepID=A0A0F9THP8_9ZZZZ
MARKKVTVSVDPKFFSEVFEKQRRLMQKKIGLDNLSQPNFSKMISGFKIRQPRQNLSKFNPKIKRRRSGI